MIVKKCTVNPKSHYKPIRLSLLVWFAFGILWLKLTWNGLLGLMVVLYMNSECPSTYRSAILFAHGMGQGGTKTLKQWCFFFSFTFSFFFKMWYHLLWLPVQTHPSHSTICFLFPHIIWYFIVFNDFIKGVSDILEHIHLLDFSVNTSMLLEHIFC